MLGARTEGVEVRFCLLDQQAKTLARLVNTEQRDIVRLALGGVLAAGGLAELVRIALGVQEIVDDLVGEADVLGERGERVALGLGGVTKIFRRDAADLGPAHPVEPFSLAFLDPPYGKGLADKALLSLREGGWLTPGALLVVEEAKAAAFTAPEGFAELERRAYDYTEFVFLRAP